MNGWMVAAFAGGGGGVLGALVVMEVRYQVDMWKYRRQILGR